MNRRSILAALIASALIWTGCQTTASAQDNGDQRVELGTVDWMRDFEAARARSQNSGKPLFVLFTEVPGCATVKGYGKRVLSHAIVSDAIESEFVPVAIFNNKPGEDREVLKSFGEPTWNNPAVRIIDADRNALAPRLYGDYSVDATIATMVQALEEANRDVPGYLTAMESEADASGRNRTAGSTASRSDGCRPRNVSAEIRPAPGFPASRSGLWFGRRHPSLFRLRAAHGRIANARRPIR